MNPINTILNIISFTSLTITSYLDYYHSRNDPYFALTEANPIYKSKSGFFNKQKAIIITIPILATLATLSLIPQTYPYAPLAYIPIIITQLLIIQRKLKNQKFMLSRQINALNNLLSPYPNPPQTTTKNNTTFLTLFPWIFSTSNNPNELQNKLKNQLQNFNSPYDYLKYIRKSKPPLP